MERVWLRVGESGEVAAEAGAVKSACTPRAGGRIPRNLMFFRGEHVRAHGQRGGEKGGKVMPMCNTTTGGIRRHLLQSEPRQDQIEAGIE